jgi:2-iminobutanoate/2-iminopropanoate deaminase
VRSAVSASGAPSAVGYCSQGCVVARASLFCSGALPIDSASGEFVAGSLGEETQQHLRNLEAVCCEAGVRLGAAVRTTIYTAAFAAFAEITDAYAEAFGPIPPGRVATERGTLPKRVRPEIDAIVSVS